MFCARILAIACGHEDAYDLDAATDGLTTSAFYDEMGRPLYAIVMI